MKKIPLKYVFVLIAIAGSFAYPASRGSYNVLVDGCLYTVPSVIAAFSIGAILDRLRGN
jgi:hypothetical protein